MNFEELRVLQGMTFFLMWNKKYSRFIACIRKTYIKEQSEIQIIIMIEIDYNILNKMRETGKKGRRALLTVICQLIRNKS